MQHRVVFQDGKKLLHSLVSPSVLLRLDSYRKKQYLRTGEAEKKKVGGGHKGADACGHEGGEAHTTSCR